MAVYNETSGTGSEPASSAFDLKSSVLDDITASLDEARARFGFEKPEEAEPEDISDESEQEVENEETVEAADEADETETQTDKGDQGTDQSSDDEFEFESDGETYKLPKAIEKHIMLHRDYTQKTQEFAAVRKEAEEAIGTKIEDLLAIEQMVDPIAYQMRTQFNGSEAQMLSYYRQNLPNDYERVLNEIELRKRIRDHLTSMKGQQEQENNAQAEALDAEAQQREIKLLETLMPEWRDVNVRQKELAEIGQFLSNAGAPDEDIVMLRKAWMFPVIRDAMKYRAGQTVRAKTNAPAPSEKLVRKNGQTAQETVSTNAVKNANKAMRNGRMRDKINALTKIL